MADLAGQSTGGALRLDFDRRLMFQFRDAVIASDAGLLAYHELGDAPGLTVRAGEVFADARTGKNGRRALVGLLRPSVFGRLAGCEDVNDADRLSDDPAMRWNVGDRAMALNRRRSTMWRHAGILSAIRPGKVLGTGVSGSDQFRALGPATTRRNLRAGR